MANNKNIENKVEEIKKIDFNEDTKEDIKKEDIKKEDNNEIDVLKKQIEEMKKIISDMNSSPKNVVMKQSEEEIEIGTYMLQGVGLTSTTDKTLSISIPYNSIQALDLSEMKKLLRQQNIRELFENGVCYFVNKEDYALLGINNHIDLSDDTLEELLNLKNVNEIIKKLNIMTSSLQNATVTNCIIYRICKMIKDNKLEKLEYITRKSLEDYFGLPFERGIKTLMSLEQLRQQ